MDTRTRAIDVFRMRLYSAPLAVFGLAKFLYMALLLAAVLGLFALFGGVEGGRSVADISIAFLAPVAFAVGATFDERTTRRKFEGPTDRVAYHRAIETETLPESGTPQHWREEMLTVLEAKSRTYFALFALFAIIAVVIFVPLVNDDLRVVSIVIVVCLLATMLFGTFYSLRTWSRVERLYHASNPEPQAVNYVSRSGDKR